MRAGIAGLAAALLSLAGPLPGAAQEAWQGVVVEAGTGAPVAGAAVAVLGGESAVGRTDRSGRWSLQLPAGEHRLRVSHPGYAPREVTLTAPREGRIALAPRPLVLDGIVATAGRRMQTLAEAAVATEVVSRADLARSGASDLAGALGGRPGLEVQGGHPAGTGIMLQGLGSERVLVLVDGEPVVGRLSGQLDLSRIPLSSVERVEVVKGPQSVLYGSDAMGGVVNVITHAPQGERDGAVSFTTGSHRRADAAATWRGGTGAWSWSADGGLRTGGIMPGVRQTADALVERRDASGRLVWRPSDALAANASLSLLDERQRWRSGQLFVFGDNLQWSGRVGARWRRGAHRLEPAAYLAGFSHLARRGTAPEPAGPAGEEETQRLGELSLLYGWTAGAHALDAGIEVGEEAITSDRVEGRDRTLLEADLFAQHTWTIGRWTLVPGGRLSLSEQWGEHLTPRLALMFRPVPELALRASAGTGYRGPSFKELYMAFANSAAGYRVRGNPDLRPESSRNLTASAEWAGRSAYGRVQAFATRYRDFIETRQVESEDAAAVYEYGNVDDGGTSGLELAAGWVRGPVRLEGGYSRLWSRDLTLDAPLLGRPAHSARASGEWAHPGGARARVSASYTGRAPVSRDADTGVTGYRGALLSLDARVSQTLSRGLDLSVGVQNLLDRAPADWPGFAGRQLYVGLGWKTSGQ